MRGRRALDDRGLGRVLLRLIAATAAAGGVSFGLAFAAGLLSFLSPCVLPLIPSYVGFLTGLSLEELQARRGTALLHALWFVAGFSLIFLALGATASALGRLLLRYQLWIGRVGGVLVVGFGLYLLGVLRPAFLMRERRLELARKPLGYLGSAVVGIAFGAAWTPCIGPILGAILTLAAVQASVGRGVALLATYALGLAIPFLITAFALDRFLSWFRRFRPYLAWVDRIAGVLLILLGLLRGQAFPWELHGPSPYITAGDNQERAYMITLRKHGSRFSATLTAMALVACAKGEQASQSADSTARNLTLAPAESTAAMRD